MISECKDVSLAKMTEMTNCETNTRQVIIAISYYLSTTSL